MGQIPKGMLGLFFLLLTALAGLCFLVAQGETIAAQNYHSDVVAEVECSNFNTNVIESCKEQATENGYHLTINPMVYDQDNHIELAEIILQYDYTVGLFDLTQQKQIRAFAR